MSYDPLGLAPFTPVVGGSRDTWGLLIDQAFSLVISPHDHSPGKGVQIPSAGLGINADVSWAGYALKAAKAISFTPVTPASMTSYANAFYVSSSDNNLWFRNNAGTNVQITAAGQLNLAAIGGITQDYAAAGANFAYDDATRTYLAQQELSGGLRPWAGIRSADLQLYQKAVSIVNSVTLKSPNALAASYAVTFPAALPAATQLLTVTSAGQLNSDGTLGSNQNITLQGTGAIKRGNRVIRTHARAQLTMNTAGGGATTPSLGSAGAGFPATSTNSIPICPGDDDFGICTINTVDVWIAVSGNTCTFTLQSVSAGGTLSAIPGATSSTGSAGQYTKLTLTPTTPPTGASIIATGGFLALQVQTLAGATCNVLSVDLNTTV